MESTGMRDMIQISQATADILSHSGKNGWIVRRADPVEAKGIGMLITYWLNPSVENTGSTCGESVQGHSDIDVITSFSSPLPDQDMVKMHRLVDWMTQLLLDHVKKVVSIPVDRMRGIIHCVGNDVDKSI
jgi:hypothetical protein